MTAGITSILFIFVFPVLIKNLKINMQSVNTCELNTAAEIFKQKYVFDPLRQESFCPPGGYIKGLLSDIRANLN